MKILHSKSRKRAQHKDSIKRTFWSAVCLMAFSRAFAADLDNAPKLSPKAREYVAIFDSNGLASLREKYRGKLSGRELALLNDYFARAASRAAKDGNAETQKSKAAENARRYIAAIEEALEKQPREITQNLFDDICKALGRPWPLCGKE